MVYLKCQKCKHNWNYKGKFKSKATCPDCRGLVDIKKQKEVIKNGRHKEVTPVIEEKRDAGEEIEMMASQELGV